MERLSYETSSFETHKIAVLLNESELWDFFHDLVLRVWVNGTSCDYDPTCIINLYITYWYHVKVNTTL